MCNNKFYVLARPVAQPFEPFVCYMQSCHPHGGAMAIDGQSTHLQMETRGPCVLPGRLGCVRNGRFVFKDTVSDW